MTPIRLRLSHPDLVFHGDVILTEHEGRWLATAMLADEPDIGTGNDPREAIRAALAALGEPFASELAAGADSLEVGDRRGGGNKGLPKPRIRAWGRD